MSQQRLRCNFGDCGAVFGQQAEFCAHVHAEHGGDVVASIVDWEKGAREEAAEQPWTLRSEVMKLADRLTSSSSKDVWPEHSLEAEPRPFVPHMLGHGFQA
ncbi:hypothetical protein DIPPA_21294 [Diplonema papillatum]|nr:hypothetical protein DIPPA_21294 [Diplonema papillatum]